MSTVTPTITRTPFAVFILVLRDNINLRLQLLGTGFAVDTPSKTIGMTAAHCIWYQDENEVERRKNGELFFVSHIERSEITGELFIPLENEDILCFKMQPIYHNTKDICLLKIENDHINTANVFPELIPICPMQFMPQSSREEYKVKLYHAPIIIFLSLKLLALEIIPSEWSNAVLMQKKYFFTRMDMVSSASGGPIVS